MNQRSQQALAVLALFICAGASPAGADGPKDNLPDAVRPIPPLGIALPAADREFLTREVAALAAEISKLRAVPAAAAFVPDVEIFHDAVARAIALDNFFSPKDITRAKTSLAAAQDRAALLATGKTPWQTQPGPQVMGYLSELDGSVQPYGLVIPATFTENSPHRWRLDTWFHGRGETLSEVNFIDDVTKHGGPFVRPDTFVLQPYGRYCNGSKFAGEVDLWEALADVKRRFRIDDDRIVVRGFSLGGASTWHLAAHFASDWAAAAPGAGFAESAQFLQVFQSEKIQPTWWEKKLWQLYDAPAYAENFRNVPLVAYSGEIDKQKQAADLMAGVLRGVGIEMTHVIGPQTAHKYHPDSVAILNRIIDRLADQGRTPLPREVSLATPTLKYNRQAWITADTLGQHWEKATITGQILDGNTGVRLQTKNVAALTLAMETGLCPFVPGRLPTVTIDGQKLAGPPPASDRSWMARFFKAGARWQAVPPPTPPGNGLRKQHDLQGPIDDAFMSPFLIVTPSGPALSALVGAWADAEQKRAITEWRRQFRGEARVKRDVDVTGADIANYNLALWGDPSSNHVFASLADKLPLHWNGEAITAGKQYFPSGHHAMIAIYPNPLNPKRYIVINSGFTFREYDYLNNARQVPKLPDWAVVDITTPPDGRFPGKIVASDFFDELWRVR